MTIPIDAFPIKRRARRVRDLRTGHWLLLGETLATLAAMSAAIHLLPFRWVVRLASRKHTTHGSRRADAVDTHEAIWAVEAVARRVPWRTVCFQKGLTLHLVLHRHAIPSVLHYGVGKGDEGELAAHVWISVDDRIVLGGDVVERFHCLASYPGS